MNETILKRIAVIAMLIDHAAVIFLERAVQPETGLMLAVSSDSLYRLDRILRAVGRQAFPIFVFCIVEGFFHTANRGKYLGRLFAAAAVSQLPFYLMNNTGPVGSELPVSLNTLATLAAGLLLIMIIDRILGPEHGALSGISGIFRAVSALLVVALFWEAAESLRLDYGGMGVTAVLLLYLLHGMPKLAPAALWLWLGCADAHEWFALPACLFLYRYNGKRGTEGMGPARRKAEKYFFYVFYPLHLVLLWGIREMI